MKSITTLLFAFICQFSFGQQPNSNVDTVHKQNSNDAPKVISIDDPSTIFSQVEKAPTFPNGGEEGFLKFVKENFQYPKKERKNNIQGTVFVQFVIRQDGSITDAHVLKGISKGLDKEAIRVISLSPKWNPGKQNGKAVNVYQRVPVRCTL